MRGATALDSEQWVRALVDNAPVMIWMGAPDGSCVDFNRGWLEYTGRTLAQELGEGWAEGVHPDDLDRCISTYHAALDKRERFRMEYRLRRADGTYGWVLDEGGPRYDAEGRFAGYIGICVDITEQKRAESALRAQTVARSLARRMLHDLILRAGVPANIVREFGRALSRDAPPGQEVRAATDAFREMGFGTLHLESASMGRYEFIGSDLLEHSVESARPTCYLTLGYLEGAVSAVTGDRALGNEMRCQSMGHPECRFSVRTI